MKNGVAPKDDGGSGKESGNKRSNLQKLREAVSIEIPLKVLRQAMQIVFNVAHPILL